MTAAERIIFVPLAGNQARFYIGVGEALRAAGKRVSFLTFHEPSLNTIRRAGFEAVSAFADRPAGPESVAEALARIAPFGVPDVSLAISHERAAYETRDGNSLVIKLAGHLEAVKTALTGLVGEDEHVEVVQEVGGFLSVAATFYAARRAGWRNTFSEPSFFRRRLFFTHDTFAAPVVRATPRAVTPEVRAYLDETLADRRIVIPAKDRAHYRSAAKKVLSGRNMRRLVEKNVDKYVRRQREEFDHLGGHVSRHLRMLRTARRLRPHYREIPNQPFIYYPLHVPADVALTIRAPEYYDQFALLDYLARVIPLTHRLVIKEHPALVGAVDYHRVTQLLRAYSHVTLLRPTINNHDVLGAADLVVTVNSKSGAEGLLRGRRILALGDSFYRASGLVATADGLRDIPDAIRHSLDGPVPEPADIVRFFQRVFDSSWPGELYLTTPENCETFAQSLIAALGSAVSPEPSAAMGAL